MKRTHAVEKRLLISCFLCLGLAVSGSAQPQPTSSHANRATGSGAASPSQPLPQAPSTGASPLDRGLVDLRDQLDLLLAGALPEEIDVSRLFGVSLSDPRQLNARVAELTRQSQELERWIASMHARRSELDDDDAAERARPEVTTTTRSVPDAAATGPEVPATDEDAAPEADPDSRADSPSERTPAAAVHSWSEARAEELRELANALPLARIQLEVARKRQEYLKRTEQRLSRMSDASRRILPTLTAPRRALRQHAQATLALAEQLAGVARRVEELETRSRAGVLVGFVSEQRALGPDLAAAASAYRAQATRMEALGQELTRLAERLESEGRRVSARFYRSVVRANGSATLDALFLEQLREQRRLRKSVSDVLTAPDLERLLALGAEARERLSAPDAIATTHEARARLEEGVDFRQRIDSTLAAGIAGLPAWELAFQNELVTLLSEQASDQTRAEAYGLSNEVLADVSSEVQLAWTRFQAGLAARRASVPTFSALIQTETGRGYSLRALAVSMIVGVWFFLRRQSARITVRLVRTLTKLPSMRGRIGLLVRGSGLLQSSLPPLLAIAALYAVLAVLGRETPIARLLHALLFPLSVYWLGREILLGATRRITTGRPALIEVKPPTLLRLRKTYAALGLVVALAYALDAVARIAVGAGRLASLVGIAMTAWVGLWAIWEAIHWRETLAKAWSNAASETTAEGVEVTIAGWMMRSALGFLLSPIALLRIALTPLVRRFKGLASGTTLMKRLRAFWLRRRSKNGEADKAESAAVVPAEYLDAFPLHPVLGEDDALILPRQGVLDQVFEQLKRWQQTRADGSLVVVGEKGSGKTTLAAQIGRHISQTEVVTVTLHGKPTTPEQLVAALAPGLGFDASLTPQALSEALCEGEERVVLVDEAHNGFLRKVDGYRAYDAIVDLVNSTTSKVFWILIFNSFTWRFLNESRGRVHYFRKLLMIPSWTAEEIQELIRLRHGQTGFELKFDQLLLSDEKMGSGRFELVEEADGYFRLLWESSGGNPRIATQLWLSSLTPASDRVLRVGMFREAHTEILSSLQDDLVFALAAMSQHENLSAKELAVVLNVSEDFARFAVQFLSEAGFFETKDQDPDRFTLSASYYRVVLKALRSRHLLFT